MSDDVGHPDVLINLEIFRLSGNQGSELQHQVAEDPACPP
jgi:hypothetical protein